MVMTRGEDFTLFGDAIDGAGLDARADLNAGRGDRALRRRRRAHLIHARIEQVLELRALPLEARGVHVGDVVRDDLNVQFLRRHTGCGDAHCPHVVFLSVGDGVQAVCCDDHCDVPLNF